MEAYFIIIIKINEKYVKIICQNYGNIFNYNYKN